MRLTDPSLMFSSAAIWRVLRCVSVAPSCEPYGQILVDQYRPSNAFGRISSSINAARNFLHFAFAPHPCSRSVCIRTLSVCDTFSILTALTKCWLLTILPKYRVLYL